MEKHFVGYWNRSVILTYGELLSAVTGICLAAEGKIRAAALCLILCGICDMFDGKIARATKRSEDAMMFGIQIDSLCDLVSFGVLPSVIGHGCGLRGGWTVLLAFYTLAALIRLGYFNVSEQKRQQSTRENRQYFEGLPVTTAAAAVPLVLLLRTLLGAAFAKVYAALLAGMGFLFIWRFRVRKIQL